MNGRRSGGVLLHPTSLPTPYGIGDFGPAAYGFVDFLDTTCLSLWQILPCGPAGYGDSPYTSYSAFAGNPLLISPDLLFQEGLLESPPIPPDNPKLPCERVDYDRVKSWKRRILGQAARALLDGRWTGSLDTYRSFCKAEADWLEDYCLFMALREEHERTGKPWYKAFAPEIVIRKESALRKVRIRLAGEIEECSVLQFLFFHQWRRLKEYANSRGIKIVGDIPFYVAEDSSDVWARRDLFLLADDGSPVAVAGVPPDYFSSTGQRWGNPLYNWPVMAGNGFKWWLRRLDASFKFADIVRIDHFRGFEAYWEIPASEKTAVNGRWVEAPGRELFSAMLEAMKRGEMTTPPHAVGVSTAPGSLPIIAEDLGAITPAVERLRDDFGLPGMYVLQFAFFFNNSAEWDSSNPYLPHNHSANAAVYTGTHDNNTTLGWYHELDEGRKDYVRRYLARDGHDIAWDMIRAAFASVAAYAVIPLQDVMSLGSEARMNIPSTPSGNWRWRYNDGSLHSHTAERLSELVRLYGRQKPAVPAAQTESEEAEADRTSP